MYAKQTEETELLLKEKEVARAAIDEDRDKLEKELAILTEKNLRSQNEHYKLTFKEKSLRERAELRQKRVLALQ